MYEGLNENQNHAISTSKNELFFVIVPKIVKSEKMQFFQFFQGLGKIGNFSGNFSNFSGKVSTTTNTRVIQQKLTSQDGEIEKMFRIKFVGL